MAKNKAKKNKPAKKQNTGGKNQKPAASGKVPAKSSAKSSAQSSAKSPAKSRAAKGSTAKDKPAISRRNLLLLLGATPVAIAGGYGIHQYDVNNKTLHDLSIIGEGQPVVLQVHDPSCALCRQLKSATESALESTPGIAYRIADLTKAEGREIGQRYGVGKVTLLLFDAEGKHVHTVQGVTPKEELITRFERYLGTTTQS